MKKLLSFLLVAVALLAMLVSCNLGKTPCKHIDEDEDGICDECDEPCDDDDDAQGEPVTVVLNKAGDYKNKITFESSTVVGKVGADLVIPVTFADGYTFEKSEPAGEYSVENKTLTIKNIQKGMNRLTVYAKEEIVFFFDFKGGSKDTASKPSDLYVEGTEITVTAGDTTKQFAGWSFGKTIANGGKLASTDKSFTFKLSQSIANTATGTKISVYPNYIESNVYRYDPNGGTINTNSVNYKNSTYYTTAVKNNKLVVTIGAQYFTTVGDVASTFYDDGTFTRDGYVLMEYNTKPDGTGEGFNLGAKYELKSLDGDVPTLYCIWAKATDANTFVVQNTTINRLNKTNDSTTPDWIESGVEITSYAGNEKTVVIPEKIGGKYVTSIAANAFVGKDVETIVMGKHILRIADGAFKNCASLKVMYMPDGIAYMSDALMDATTKDGFTDLRMNAVMPPKLSPNAWAGLFAIKRFLIPKEDMKEEISSTDD